MSTNPILVRTNVRKSTADDLPAAKDSLHCQSTFDGDVTYSNGQSFTLTSKEEQTVHNLVLTSQFRDLVDHPELCSRPSKDSLIIHPDGIYDEHYETNEDVVVILYQGTDEAIDALNDVDWGTLLLSADLPVTNASDTSDTHDTGLQQRTSLFTAASPEFQRSWLSTSQNSESRYRWFKIQHVHDVPEDADWSQILASLHQSIGLWASNVRLCHKRVKISRRVISTQQLAQCGNNAVRDTEISESTGIPLHAIKKLAALKTAAKSTPPTQSHSEGSFMGAELISVVQRSFCTDKDDSLYIVETPRTNLVYANKPCTLADVVSQRHHNQFSLLRSREGVAMLNEEFGQVKISVRVNKSTETRTILGFREGRAIDAPLPLRHYAWSSKGEAYGLPNLPCVDVGTKAKPLLLPLELCNVLPSQRLRGTIDAPLSRQADLRRLTIASRLQPDNFENTWGRVLAPSFVLNGRDTRHEKIARACAHIFPNLLFVEASSTEVESSNWRSLEESVRAQIKESLEKCAAKYASNLLPVVVPTEQSPRLSLFYKDDAGLSDRWTEQLRKFVTNNSGSQDQLTFVIVYLPAESRQGDMYKIIKKACDITAGAQTFFVKHATLEAKVCQSPSQGLSHVAGDLRHRICLRNPPMLAAAGLNRTSSEPKHLVIAMHVSHIGFPSKFRVESGPVTDLYIIALVSSDLKTGGHYHTEVKLYSADQVRNLNMGELFKPFIDSLPPAFKHKVTILRSGHFTEQQVTPSTSNASEVPTRARTTEGEMDSIRKAFISRIAPLGLTFITLAEDKILKLHVDTANLKLPALVLAKDTRILDKDDESSRVTHVHRQNANTGVIALKDHRSATAPNTNAKSVTRPTTFLPMPISKPRSGIQRGDISPGSPLTPLRPADPLSTRPGSAMSTHASPSPFNTPSGTMLGVSAASEFHSRVSSGIQVPLPDHGEDEDDASVITQRVGQMALETTEPAITELQAQLLAKLWDAQELELSGTKWPIVTHLAHLAVKRAHLHIGDNDWNGTTGTTTAPYFLPAVHQNVRHSLYYL